MALKQIAFFGTTLSADLATGTSISISLSDYTLLNSNLSNTDTIELVLERLNTTQREIILVTKTSNDNYSVTTRGLYGTTEQSHQSGVEVTCDDTPGYYNGLIDSSALPDGSASVGIPASKIKREVWTDWVPTWTNLTVGNGTVTAKYLRLGNLIIFRLGIIFGSTTSISGSVSFSLPVTAVSYGTGGTHPWGLAEFTDASGSRYDGVAIYNTTSLAVLQAKGVSTYVTVTTDLSSTVPFTWTTSDEIHVNAFYEAA